MSNKEALTAELTELIKKMNIPQKRKTINKTDDLRWLKRSLAERNSGHQNFKRAMEILKEIV